MSAGGDLVRLTAAGSGPEAAMIEGLLAEHGIRVLVRRPIGFDVPGFLAGGPRELLVRAGDHAEAAALVESHFGLR